MTTSNPPSTKPPFDFTSPRAWFIFCAVVLGIAIISGRANNDGTSAPSLPSCNGEIAKCTSATQFVKDNERLFHELGDRCQRVLERNAKYEVKWGSRWQNFTSYWTDQQEHLSQGNFVLVDTSVKLQNGFGAFVSGQARCKVNIKSGVYYSTFYPN